MAVRQRAGVNMSSRSRKTPRDKRREQLRRRQCLPLASSSLATVVVVIGSLASQAEAFVGPHAQVARLSALSQEGIHGGSKCPSFRRRLPPPASLSNSRSTRWAKLAVRKWRSVRGFDVSKKFKSFQRQCLLHSRPACPVVFSYAHVNYVLASLPLCFEGTLSVTQVRTTKCNYRDDEYVGQSITVVAGTGACDAGSWYLPIYDCIASLQQRHVY